MKKIHLLFMFLLLANLTLFAQQNNAEVVDSPMVSKCSKVKNVLNKFSITVTAGSPSVNFKELNNATLQKSKGVSMGELSVNYKMNSRFSFGIGTMGSLGLCHSGYYNAENNFVPFKYDEGDDDEQDDGNEDPEDNDDIENENNNESNDGDCGEFGDNLVGSLTYKFSEKIPFFVQAAGGYSFGSNAPVYSAMIGYNQKIFKGLGIIGGVRYSDVLHQKPADAVKMAPSSGIRAELGLSWNF